MPRVFGAAAAEYFEMYGGGVEHLAKIGEGFCFSCDVCVGVGVGVSMSMCVLMDCCLAAKNHKHSLSNPYAQFRAGYSEAEVLASPQITNELTKFMCSPTSVERNIPRFISGSHG